MLVVASSIPGRLRVRHPGLRDKSVAGEVSREIGAVPGVAGAEPNLSAGSLLISYDASRIGQAEILGHLRIPEPPQPMSGGEVGTGNSGESSPRLLEAGLAGTLGLTVAGAVLGRHRLHVTAGILFLVAVGAHLLAGRAGES